MHRVQKFLIAKRLGQKLDGAGFHGAHGHAHVRVAGNENDRNVDVRLNELPLKVETATARQPHVENQAAGRIGSSRRQKFAGRFKGLRLQIDGAHQQLHGVPHGAVVVDHEYDGARIGHLQAAEGTRTVSRREETQACPIQPHPPEAA